MIPLRGSGAVRPGPLPSRLFFARIWWLTLGQLRACGKRKGMTMSDRCHLRMRVLRKDWEAGRYADYFGPPSKASAGSARPNYPACDGDADSPKAPRALGVNCLAWRRIRADGESCGEHQREIVLRYGLGLPRAHFALKSRSTSPNGLKQSAIAR